MSSTKKRSPLGTDASTARREGRARRHYRLRKKVSGTPERPRLVVNRSSRHIHAQIVDASTIWAWMWREDRLTTNRGRSGVPETFLRRR